MSVRRRPFPRWLRLAALALLIGVALYQRVDRADLEPVATPSAGTDRRGPSELSRLFAERQSDVVVEASGEVEKVLRDDLDGSRHQRFIVRIGPGQTVLVSHNIDLAPRIDNLRAGDRIDFRGEYEWNERGGVIHWTHRDPHGSRPGGWIRHEGETYR